ncbi:hypothetical protein KIPB_006963 [Kipferlia bialata]|uniref:Uncharacterized protein n=1 Tax=Kipferlia bialata TaxID=797122 RepID=A0A9K3GJM6_9EUKA|nr:hypothetical protein KIPB_006963 [Kipferlia bialata]|eukprot:g6963.t1
MPKEMPKVFADLGDQIAMAVKDYDTVAGRYSATTYNAKRHEIATHTSNTVGRLVSDVATSVSTSCASSSVTVLRAVVADMRAEAEAEAVLSRDRARDSHSTLARLKAETEASEEQGEAEAKPQESLWHDTLCFDRVGTSTRSALSSQTKALLTGLSCASTPGTDIDMTPLTMAQGIPCLIEDVQDMAEASGISLVVSVAEGVYNTLGEMSLLTHCTEGTEGGNTEGTEGDETETVPVSSTLPSPTDVLTSQVVEALSGPFLARMESDVSHIRRDSIKVVDSLVRDRVTLLVGACAKALLAPRAVLSQSPWTGLGLLRNALTQAKTLFDRQFRFDGDTPHAFTPQERLEPRYNEALSASLSLCSTVARVAIPACPALSLPPIERPLLGEESDRVLEDVRRHAEQEYAAAQERQMAQRRNQRVPFWVWALLAFGFRRDVGHVVTSPLLLLLLLLLGGVFAFMCVALQMKPGEVASYLFSLVSGKGKQMLMDALTSGFASPQPKPHTEREREGQAARLSRSASDL